MEKDPQTHAIIGAAMEVHRELGHGFLEAVYQECFSFELEDRGIPFRREVSLPLAYKGRRLTSIYRADFLCFESVLVETKAILQLTGADQAQVLNELKATGCERALLINFGTPSLQFHRMVFESAKNLRHSAKSADS